MKLNNNDQNQKSYSQEMQPRNPQKPNHTKTLYQKPNTNNTTILTKTTNGMDWPMNRPTLLGDNPMNWYITNAPHQTSSAREIKQNYGTQKTIPRQLLWCNFYVTVPTINCPEIKCYNVIVWGQVAKNKQHTYMCPQHNTFSIGTIP